MLTKQQRDRNDGTKQPTNEKSTKDRTKPHASTEHRTKNTRSTRRYHVKSGRGRPLFRRVSGPWYHSFANGLTLVRTPRLTETMATRTRLHLVETNEATTNGPEERSHNEDLRKPHSRLQNDDATRITIIQRSRRTHDAIDTKLPRTAPTEGLAKHTHNSHDEQTGTEDDEQTETCSSGITTKTIRLDTIGALRRGCHDAYRAHYERTNNEAYESTDKTNVGRDNTRRMKNAIRKTSDVVPTRNNAHGLPTTRIENYASKHVSRPGPTRVAHYTM